MLENRAPRRAQTLKFWSRSPRSAAQVLSNPGSLSYRISETDRILVISLVGELTRSNQLAIRELIRKVRETSAEAVVLNLLDMRDIERCDLPDFAKLQAAVRAKQAKLRLCALKPNLEVFLSEMGLLRPEEVHRDLKAALVSLIL